MLFHWSLLVFLSFFVAKSTHIAHVFLYTSEWNNYQNVSRKKLLTTTIFILINSICFTPQNSNNSNDPNKNFAVKSIYLINQFSEAVFLGIIEVWNEVWSFVRRKKNAKRQNSFKLFVKQNASRTMEKNHNWQFKYLQTFNALANLFSSVTRKLWFQKN